MGPEPLASRRVEQALAALADPEAPPAAGVAAAIAAAAAASLAELAAGLAFRRLDGEEREGAERQRELSARAGELREGLLRAADADVAAYARVLEAEPGRARDEALADAADPPARIVADAAEVAEAAAATARAASGWPFQPDAVAAAGLSAAAATAASGLVAANLAGRPVDERIGAAAEAARRAEAAATEARKAAESPSNKPAPE